MDTKLVYSRYRIHMETAGGADERNKYRNRAKCPHCREGGKHEVESEWKATAGENTRKTCCDLLNIGLLTIINNYIMKGSEVHLSFFERTRDLRRISNGRL